LQKCGSNDRRFSATLIGVYTRKLSVTVRGGTALVLFFVAGCAPDLGPKSEFTKPLELASTASLNAPRAEWPLDTWWKPYNDPQLNQLIEEALHDSPDLKIAEARIRAADAMGDIQNANLYPTVVGNGAVAESEGSRNVEGAAFRNFLPSGWHHSAQMQAAFQYELDFFGKNRASLSAALSEVEAARAGGAAARLQISAAVASVYGGLMQLYADQQTAQEAVRLHRETANLVRKRVKAGMDNEASYSQAQAQLKAANVGTREIERLITVTQHQLAALLGKGPDRGLTVAAVPQHLTDTGLPISLSADLIGRRPDIVAARRMAEAASAHIDVANANFYPNVDLTGAFGLQTLDIKYLVQASSEMGTFGPAITLPIFDYGRNTGIYKAARAGYDAAVAEYNKTLTNALREVADAYATRRAIEDELVGSKDSLADSENAYRILKVRYEAGFARYLDLLTAETLLLQQKRAVADLGAQAFIADVALVRSLGGGYVDKH
jgi:NodT family efflux transporter outer membrane factor (OMF) lipoprotein